MKEKNKAFRMYQSEEDIIKQKAKTWTISVRVNAKEQELIKEMKRILNIHMDGTALKICAKVGFNVLRSSFGDSILSYISSRNRKREIIE